VGNIVRARELGGYILVWTEDALWIGTYVGDPNQTYRWDLVDNNCGIVGPNAVAVLSRVAYWIGPDLQFRRYALGGLPEILPCPIWRDFEGAVTRGSQHLICGSTVAKFNEVWFHYGSGAGYVAFNVNDGSWFRGDAGCSAMLDSGLINEALEDDAYFTAILGSTGGFVYARELGASSSGVGSADGPSSYYVQSSAFYIDSARRGVMIQAIKPDAEYRGVGADIDLTLYVRQRPQSAPTAKGPTALEKSDTTITTRKSLRAFGNLMAVRFSGSDTRNCDMRLGKPVFEYVITSGRP
jgi:hypothetical protein